MDELSFENIIVSGIGKCTNQMIGLMESLTYHSCEKIIGISTNVNEITEGTIGVKPYGEIAGEMEVAIYEAKLNTTKDVWQLNVTSVSWNCLHKCWADKIYLRQLAHRFWKLNLQILARYYTWSGEMLEKKLNINNVQFLVAMYSDIETLSVKLTELFELVSQRLSSFISTETIDSMKKSLDESIKQLLSRLNGISNKIIRAVAVESVSALRQVSEVPRLFRRTNRDTPSKALPYVSAILLPPTTFQKNNASNAKALQWLKLIFSDITKQYYTSVCDVLTSVQKTEESLRRLKKIRDRGGGVSGISNSSSERGGDDDKIRLQLYIDVNSYCRGIEDLKIQRHEIEQLTSLLNLVETTQAKPEIKS